MSVTQSTSVPLQHGNWDKVAELVHTFAHFCKQDCGKKGEGIMRES